MEIQKEIISKIEREYFFIEGTLDLDGEYFINKIEEGIKESSLYNKTSVKGGMTEWDFFLKDKKFYPILVKIIDCIEQLKLVRHKFTIRSVWGVRTGFGEYAQEHDHLPSLISGVLYLHDHSQKLYFPQIKKEVIPQRGKFALFSSFLNHYTRRNIIDKNKYGISFNFNIVNK